MRHGKLLLATIGATVLLGALTGFASARNFSTSSQTWRVLFREVIFMGGFGNIPCEIQLEGSLHSRTIAKVAGSLIGYVTEAIVLRCVSGLWTILRETLPWHVRYAAFSGTLPNITSIRAHIIGFAFRYREPNFTCLATTEAAHPAVVGFNLSTGVISSAEISGEGISTTCGLAGTFSSNRETNVTVLNSTARITVTLI